MIARLLGALLLLAAASAAGAGPARLAASTPTPTSTPTSSKKARTQAPPGREGRGEEPASEPTAVRRAASVTLLMPPGEDVASSQALLAVAPRGPVTARDLRRSVLRLYQAGRCRDVVVREADAPAPPGESGAWVDLTFTCEQHRLLGSLAIALEGPSPLGEGPLRVAVDLAPGAPVDEDDLDRATERVRVALRKRGHLAAEVRVEVRGDRPAAVTLLVRAGPATRVASLALPGAGGDEAALRAGLSLQPGAVLDEDRLAADQAALRAALHAGGRWRARVGAPRVELGEAGASVALPVELGPRVAVVLRGALAFTSAELTAQLGLDPAQGFDAPAIDAAADRLRSFYRSRGYATAHVEVVERLRGEELTVAFHLDEGRPYRLVAVRFEGSALYSDADLAARLQALLLEELSPAPAGDGAERARLLAASVPGVRPPRQPPPPLPVGAFLDEVALERAAERLVEELRADGYLEAVLAGWSAALDARLGEVQVVLRLREGERTMVETISFDGVTALPVAELVKEARLSPGDPLVYERVEATRVALLKRYVGLGHAYARVEAREALDPAAHLAQVRFLVEEGPQVRLGRILISGNTRTREDVVRRSLEVKEGEVHDPEAMARSQAALLRLGVFRSVALRLQDPEVPEQVKDLLVEVSERPWQSLATGAGFSIADGPRVFLEYGRPNLLGRALELTARTKLNYPLSYFRPDLAGVSPKNTFEGRADVGLRAPRLDPLPLPVTGRADLIAERLRRRTYDLARVSAILGADLAVTSRVSVSLQYELEVDQIDMTGSDAALTQADQERLRYGQGTTTLHSVRPSLTLDYRDNAAHPRSGWYLTGSTELAHSIGSPGNPVLFLPGSETYTNLLKLQATTTGYLPVGPGTVLALSVRGGRVVPLDSRSVTIIPKRFFLGGASTVRGFAEEEMVPQDQRAGIAEEARHCSTSLSAAGCTQRGLDLVNGQTAASDGGEAFLLVKGELRVALGGSLEGGLFLDLGNLWLDPRNYRILDLRPSVGVGLRFLTPVGPAALDLGFNLSPDRRLNERILAPHFTIGLF